jgi:hypothetical protein
MKRVLGVLDVLGMLGWAFIGVLVVTLMPGCLASRLCANDDDCGSGGVCDVELGFCVFDPDGGTCKVHCEAFQTCEPTSTGGACRDVSLRIVWPAENSEHEANAQVELAVEAVDSSGRPLAASRLPAWGAGVSGAPSSLVRDGLVRDGGIGGLYLGHFVLRADRGAARLGVGWEGLDASVGVLTTTCDLVSCTSWEECQPTPTGGRCVDASLQLRWRLPVEGGGVGPATTGVVDLELEVSRADGGAFASTVPYALVGRSAGVLQLDAAAQRWRAVLDAGIDEGRRTLVAGWDGGPTASTSFEVVTTPVAVRLFPQTPPARSAEDTDIDGVPRWKKFEVVPVQVESTRPLTQLTAAQFGDPSGVAPSSACQRPCPDGGHCACFQVDLAQRSLVMSPGAINGTVGLALNPVQDIYGNPSLPTSPATIEVTRFKWVRTLSVDGSALPTAIAITPTGTVLVGANTSSTASLMAFRPDGRTLWQDTTSYFQFRAGPLVGTQGIYLGLSVPERGDLLRRVDLNGQSPRDVCGDSAGLFTLSSPGLALAALGPNETIWAVRVGGADGNYALRAEPLSGVCISSPPLSAGGRSEVAVSGQEVLVGGRQSSPVTLLSTELDGGVISTRGTLLTQPVIPQSLFALGPGLWGGAGDPNGGGVFVFSSPADGGTLSGTVASVRWQRNGGGPGVAGGTRARPIIYAGTVEGDVVARPVDVEGGRVAEDGGLMRTVSPLEYQTSHAPLLGRGGRLYLLGRRGVLRSVDAASLAQEWFWTVPAALASGFDTSNATELNLDLNRDAADPCGAGQPGVLYFATSSSSGARLWAILVDSAGVDRNAPWPRAQHDPANSANLGTDLGPYTCP